MTKRSRETVPHVRTADRKCTLSEAVVVSLNRKNGNAGEPSGNWCLRANSGGVSAEVRDIIPIPRTFLRLYMQNPAI